MLRIIKTTILILLFSLIGFSQPESLQKLFPLKSNGKCGYINQNGKVIVPAQYDFCDVFSEGLAGVSLAGKSGYIDESGQLKIALQFDGNFPESFSEGYAAIRVNNQNGETRWGYVDKIGNVRFLEGVSEIDSFYEGLAKAKKNEKYGFIDARMNFVIPPTFDFVRSFADGRAWISDNSGKYSYIDKNGKSIITGSGAKGNDFSEGLAAFRNKVLNYGYIDRHGKVIIIPQFHSACNFREGVACVEIDGKFGYIDKTGKFVIMPRFEEAENFSAEGIAVVKEAGKYGFIDKKGKFVISPQFDRALWLNGLGLVEIDGVKKYINLRNETVLQLETSNAGGGL